MTTYTGAVLHARKFQNNSILFAEAELISVQDVHEFTFFTGSVDDNDSNSM